MREINSCFHAGSMIIVTFLGQLTFFIEIPQNSLHKDCVEINPENQISSDIQFYFIY